MWRSLYLSRRTILAINFEGLLEEEFWSSWFPEVGATLKLCLSGERAVVFIFTMEGPPFLELFLDSFLKSSLVVFSWVESIGVCSPVESLLGPHWPLL